MHACKQIMTMLIGVAGLSWSITLCDGDGASNIPYIYIYILIFAETFGRRKKECWSITTLNTLYIGKTSRKRKGKQFKTK